MASGSEKYEYINANRSTAAGRRNIPPRVQTQQEAGTPF